MLKKYYKTGEFAALCGVTKHTLFHYDEINLLRPGKTDKNGYRYYTIDQFWEFTVISMLKEAGTPLSEIKRYLQHHNNRPFIETLKEKLAHLKAEGQKIKKMQALLADTISMMQNTVNITTGTIQFLECEEEYLIITETHVIDNPTEKAMIDAMGKHLQYCLQLDIHYGLHTGEIVLQKNIEQGIFLESYYYSRIPRKINDNRLFIKPQGTYAVTNHRGGYDTLFNAYKNLTEQVTARGYAVAGNIYEEDVIDYFSESNPDNYILKISMQVETV